LLRFRGDRVQAGEIRPVREGQPLGKGELVRLKPLHRDLPVCEIDVLHSSTEGEPEQTEQTEGARSSTGPVRVSTGRYRRNWSVVFGRKQPADAADEPDYSVN
jgi:hypothetical protein